MPRDVRKSCWEKIVLRFYKIKNLRNIPGFQDIHITKMLLNSSNFVRHPSPTFLSPSSIIKFSGRSNDFENADSDGRL